MHCGAALPHPALTRPSAITGSIAHAAEFSQCRPYAPTQPSTAPRSTSSSSKASPDCAAWQLCVQTQQGHKKHTFDALRCSTGAEHKQSNRHAHTACWAVVRPAPHAHEAATRKSSKQCSRFGVRPHAACPSGRLASDICTQKHGCLSTRSPGWVQLEAAVRHSFGATDLQSCSHSVVEFTKARVHAITQQPRQAWHNASPAQVAGWHNAVSLPCNNVLVFNSRSSPLCCCRGVH